MFFYVSNKLVLNIKYKFRKWIEFEWISYLIDVFVFCVI